MGTNVAKIRYICDMKLKANCKINLGLDILRRREDGFHDLETVMIPVTELYDVITVERTDEVEFVQTGIVVDCPPETNLCLRAYNLVRSRYDVPPVRITLDKRVPFGAGLGGGSSDASTVILALNEEFNLGVSVQEMVDMAAALGSDTAFFIENRVQLCTGRGEIMHPIDLDLKGLWMVVIKPPFGISTAEAYSGVRPAVPARTLVERLSDDRSTWQEQIANGFEPHIFAAHPRLAELKQTLLNAGALYAAMSGSGSALFGLFESKPEVEFADDIFVHTQQL